MPRGLFKTVKRSILFLSKQVLESRYCTTKQFPTDPPKGEGEDSGGGDLQVEEKIKVKTNHNEKMIKINPFKSFRRADAGQLGWKDELNCHIGEPCPTSVPDDQHDQLIRSWFIVFLSGMDDDCQDHNFKDVKEHDCQECFHDDDCQG